GLAVRARREAGSRGFRGHNRCAAFRKGRPKPTRVSQCRKAPRPTGRFQEKEEYLLRRSASESARVQTSSIADSTSRLPIRVLISSFAFDRLTVRSTRK